MTLSEGKLFRRMRFVQRSAAAHFFAWLLRRGDGSPVFAWEPLSLMYRGDPVEWVSVFTYLGTTVAVADTDIREVLRGIAMANVRKANGIVKSVAGSTVVMPTFRLAHLHQSLASSLATVNAAVSWAPAIFVTQEWAEGEACYAWLLGGCLGRVDRFRWRWSLMFQFPYESAVVLVAVAKFLLQMHTSPPSSFFGALGISLWSESRAHSGAWMCGALRWWGWCFGSDIGGQRGRPPLSDGTPAWMFAFSLACSNSCSMWNG